MADRHTSRSSWLRCPEPRPRAAVRLVCLAHAGGSAGAYRSWAALLPSGIELVAVQYPGREDRHGDLFSADLDTLAADVVSALNQLPPRPTVLFGHSMGAVVAYEIARGLAQRGLSAQRLIVSGRRAPTVRWGGRLHKQDDAALLAELNRLGGTAPEVLADEELRRTVLRYIRDDYRLVETYRAGHGPGPGCPITVFTGEEDPELAVGDAREWHRLGAGTDEVDVQTFRGGHFYLVPRRAEVVEAVVSRLDRAAVFGSAVAVSFP